MTTLLAKETPMSIACHRCNGMLVKDQLGVEPNTFSLNCELIRCLNCGMQWDPVMAKNAAQGDGAATTPSGRRRAPRTMVWKGEE